MAKESKKIFIVGIGDDGREGLTAAARQVLDRAALVLSSDRPAPSVANAIGGRLSAGLDYAEIVRRIEGAGDQEVAVLASGDPLFYGTARFLCDRLGKDRFEVLPHVSSMQLAFARVKESWDEAYLTNLAHQTLDRAVERIRTAEKVGLFTTEVAPPKKVAETLLAREIDYFTVYVCENLGAPDERVTQGELSDIAAMDFSPLNVLILVRKPNVPDRPAHRIGRRLFGNPDEMFLQSQPKRGLLTPAEVRSMALAELDIGPSSIVWDVGAGSGSVAIEAAQIAVHGAVYAIEMDPEDHQLIAANAKKFQVANLVPVLGRAPDAWRELPAPDAIFVGGTGRTISSIVEAALERLRPGGRIVANVASVENIQGVFDILQTQAGDVQTWMINLARGTTQMDRLRFEALNPTFLLAAVK